jgi:outer membrane protein TolC
MLEDAKLLEEFTAARHNAGVGSKVDLHQARANRLEIEIALEREKNK